MSAPPFKELLPARSEPTVTDNSKSIPSQSRQFTREEKDLILKEVETSKHTVVQKKWGISSSTLKLLLKKHKRVHFSANPSQWISQDKLRQNEWFQRIDTWMIYWLCEAGQRGMSVTGSQIQVKATEMAEQMGVLDQFEATKVWLCGFKSRNGLVLEGTNIDWKTLTVTDGHHLQIPEQANQLENVMAIDQLESATATDESGIVSESEYKNRSDFLWDLFTTYKCRDVFGVTVTALLFQMTPDRLPISGSLSDTEPQLTVLLCSNADGTEKMCPLVVGRHFRSAALNGTAVEFRHHPRAWMTRGVFRDWLLRLDRQWARLGRRGLVVAESSPAHDMTDVRLRNVVFQLLPSFRAPKEGLCVWYHLSSALRDCVARGIKIHYRHHMMERILAGKRVAGGGFHKCSLFNLDEAIHAIGAAWTSVSPASIAKAWGCDGLPDTQVKSKGGRKAAAKPLGGIQLWRRVMVRLNVKQTISFLEYVDCDADVSTEEGVGGVCSLIGDRDVLAKSGQSRVNYVMDLVGEEDAAMVMRDEEERKEENVEKGIAGHSCSVSEDDAFTCVEILRAFLVHHETLIDDSSHDGLDAIEDFIAACVLDGLAEGGCNNPVIGIEENIVQKEIEKVKVINSDLMKCVAMNEVVQQPADASFEHTDNLSHSVADTATTQPALNMTTSARLENDIRATTYYHSRNLSDPDVLYAMNLIDRFKRLSPKHKALAQLQIEKVMFEFSTS